MKIRWKTRTGQQIVVQLDDIDIRKQHAPIYCTDYTTQYNILILTYKQSDNALFQKH
jgi:hypothetical protein